MKRATTALSYDQHATSSSSFKDSNSSYSFLQGVDGYDVPLKYVHRLSLYKEAPTGDIHLQDLERLAIARLQCKK